MCLCDSSSFPQYQPKSLVTGIRCSGCFDLQGGILRSGYRYPSEGSTFRPPPPG